MGCLVDSSFLCMKATAATWILLEDGELDLCTWHHGGWGEWCGSRSASPDVRWSPLVFGKWHLHSHSDFPQEAHSTAWPHTTLSTHILHAVSSPLSSVEWLVNSRFPCLDATAANLVLIKDGELDSCTWLHGGWDEQCVSRGASPDVRWSPPVFGKRHLHSHPDFPWEARSTAWPHTTLSAHVSHAVVDLQEFLKHGVKLQLFMFMCNLHRIGIVGRGGMIY